MHYKNTSAILTQNKRQKIGTLWSQESYFEFLRKHNVSWNAYYYNDLWAIAYFEDMNHLPNSGNIKAFSEFYNDLKSDNLSSFIWLQPSMTTSDEFGPPNWQHPDASVKLGETLIKSVYQALKNSSYWNESALLITFDEHGGFFGMCVYCFCCLFTIFQHSFGLPFASFFRVRCFVYFLNALAFVCLLFLLFCLQVLTLFEAIL